MCPGTEEIFSMILWKRVTSCDRFQHRRSVRTKADIEQACLVALGETQNQGFQYPPELLQNFKQHVRVKPVGFQKNIWQI
jgi:hypothetical protein